MTPAQVEEAARRRYNAESDTFFSQDELFKIIYEGEQILATEAFVIEDTDTSITTVAGTRAYNFPSLTIAIKRVEYDGQKLEKTDFREDDRLTLSNATTTTSGTPQYYQEWDDQLLLRPIPDAAETLTVYRYKEATLLTTASTTLSTPVYCHSALINYVAMFMAMKDENYRMADRFEARWEKDVLRLKAFTRKKKRTDGFTAVKDEESLGQTLIGTV